jgi:AAA domain
MLRRDAPTDDASDLTALDRAAAEASALFADGVAAFELQQAGVDEPVDDREPEQIIGPAMRATREAVIAEAVDDPLVDPIARAILRGEVPAIDSVQPINGGWSETFWRTAREVVTTTPEAVEWVLRPWVAMGSITELTAKVKAGKTTLSMHAIRAVVSGLEFLGWTALRGPVVLLTEERVGTLRAALTRAGLLDCADLHILRRQDARGHDWADVVAEAVAKCHAVGALLLIVDTLSLWAGLRGEDENASGAAAGAMEPLQAAAASGLAVLVVRHERKSGGEVGDAGRGSSAFSGAVDIAVTLRRLEGDATARNARRLDAAGRYDETPETLVVELTEHGYVARGTESALTLQRAAAAVLAALPTAEDGDKGGLTVEALVEVVKLPRTTVVRSLDDLRSEGRVKATGAGKKGDPRRFLSTGFHVSDPALIRVGQKQTGEPDASLESS